MGGCTLAAVQQIAKLSFDVGHRLTSHRIRDVGVLQALRRIRHTSRRTSAYFKLRVGFGVLHVRRRLSSQTRIAAYSQIQAYI